MNKRNWQIIFLNCICVLALMVVLFPLLLIAQYNYPSADDWSFSRYCYEALQDGEGLIGVIKGVLESIKYYYFNWEGRYAISFLGALQPGIWGEKYYSCVAWLLIGSIVVSEFIFFRFILRSEKSADNRWLWLPVVVPPLLLQILYCPAPIESFYWYNGAVNYTFMYSISLVLMVLFWNMATKGRKGWKYILQAICVCMFTVLVGGNNFATSLSTLLMLSVCSVIFWFYDKRAFKRSWFVTVLMAICLAVCIFAPGNDVRINSNFSGNTGNAMYAIGMSLVRSFLNIYSWTNIKIILMVIFIFPFIWMCVKNMSYDFKLPGIFSTVSFCIYASQLAATMYVDGSAGGGRMAAILYYSYILWLVGNVIYWLGWINKRQKYLCNLLEKLRKKYSRLLILYCGVVGSIIVVIIYTMDLKQISSYRAYRDWRQGWAQQYAIEWDARLEVLHDEMVKDVKFAPLSVYPELLLYTDLQEEWGYVWVNEACAQYYGKDSITVIAQE